MKIKLLNMFRKHIRKTSRFSKDDVYKAKEMFPQLSANIIDAFFENYGYVMPLSLLVKVQVICNITKPDLVVEFGSGLSTVIISSAISNHNGFLFTFDESLKWLTNTYGLVKHSGNVAFVGIEQYPHGINHSVICQYIQWRAKPKLIVIDGPSKGSRFSPSAIALYKEFVSEQCVYVIDDTDRVENDQGATDFARDHSLYKYDFSDPVYINHKYSILLPKSIDPKIFLSN